MYTIHSQAVERAREEFDPAFHYRSYVWITLGWYREQWWKAEVAQDSQVNCTDAELEQLLERTIAIQQFPVAENRTVPTDVSLVSVSCVRSDRGCGVVGVRTPTINLPFYLLSPIFPLPSFYSQFSALLLLSSFSHLPFICSPFPSPFSPCLLPLSISLFLPHSPSSLLLPLSPPLFLPCSPPCPSPSLLSSPILSFLSFLSSLYSFPSSPPLLSSLLPFPPLLSLCFPLLPSSLPSPTSLLPSPKKTPQEFLDAYNQRLNSGEAAFSFEFTAYHTYDAAWALAFAMNR